MTRWLCDRRLESWLAAQRSADGVLVVCGGVGALDDAMVSRARFTSPDPVEQQTRRFPIVVLDSCVVGLDRGHSTAAVHQAVQHVERRGRLVVVGAAVGLIEPALGFERQPCADGDEAVVFRRTDRTTVHDLVWDARESIGRVTAPDLAVELRSTNPPLLVDTRTDTDRERMGVIDGSIHVPRTVLEWHLDPANGYRHRVAPAFDQPIVVVCNGGYSSSLAAASLSQIGFGRVRDLVGGVRSWLRHGLPVVVPDHAHLDL